MVNGLSACGRLDEARTLFVEMPQRDICSWNTMMSGSFRNGEYEETLTLFVSMLQSSNLHPNSISFSCAMKACGALRSPGLGLQLHGLVIKFGFLGEPAIEISILDIYVKCGFMDLATRQFELLENPDIFCWNSMILGLSRSSSSLERSRELFNLMPERNIVSWNTMISSLHQHGHRVEALSLFAKLNREGFEPDAMTYASALGACASIPDAIWGRHLHARFIRLRSTVDAFLGGALVDMYAKIGHLGAAKQTFDGLTEPDLASWTSITRGFVQSGFVKEAIILFNQMRKVPLSPDEVNLATVLGACSSRKLMGLGIQLHSIAVKMGFDVSTVVANALTAMYAKTGSVHDAHLIFSSMAARDVVSWTTMITAYSQMGDLANALSTFRKMPERNVVTWNAMLASYMQNELREEGLKMYVLMLREAEARPDSITFTTLLCACADLGALRLGNQVFSQTAKFGVGSDVSVANVSVKLYARCGRIEEAREIFYSINGKNLISWNTMITGYAQNGLGKKAIEAFESMLLTSTNPDQITFIGLLSACRHAGLVSEGKYYFASMMKRHNIFPGTEHIACMVDLLGRAGLLGEAKAMIDDMETDPTAEIWGALLNACKIHSSVELAENAVQNLLKLDFTHSGGYSLLTHIYADSGMSDAAAGVRKLMKDRGIRKNPGCSWLEFDSRIHVFVVNEANHPQIEDILVALDQITVRIQAKGYENRVGSQSHHSEKLALAFGLINLPSWAPIHIMKNLRICADCHSFSKFVSLVFNRELVIRDACRFHHFRDGLCSCGDYW